MWSAAPWPTRLSNSGAESPIPLLRRPPPRHGVSRCSAARLRRRGRASGTRSSRCPCWPPHRFASFPR